MCKVQTINWHWNKVKTNYRWNHWCWFVKPWNVVICGNNTFWLFSYRNKSKYIQHFGLIPFKIAIQCVTCVENKFWVIFANGIRNRYVYVVPIKGVSSAAKKFITNWILFGPTNWYFTSQQLPLHNLEISCMLGRDSQMQISWRSMNRHNGIIFVL